MFSIRLKQLREQAGYSQSVLARKLGVRQSTVGMWESGKNMPQNAKLEMMASIFNVSTDYLLGRSDEPNRKPSAVYSRRYKAGRKRRECRRELPRDATGIGSK